MTRTRALRAAVVAALATALFASLAAPADTPHAHVQRADIYVPWAVSATAKS